MRKLIITLSLIQLAAAGPASAQALYNSFESAVDLSSVTAYKSTIAQTATGVTNGKSALSVSLQPTQFPGIHMRPGQSMDISAAGAIAFDVTDPGTSAVEMHMQIYDALSTSSVKRTRSTAPGYVTSGQTVTMYMPLAPLPDPMTYGMRFLPQFPSSAVNLSCYGSSAFDPTQMAEVDLWTPQVTTTTPIIVDNVRVLPQFSASWLNGMVDAYGQYAGSTWAGKISTTADLAANKTAEDTWLTAHPVPTERDSYGAWSTGPKLTTTGYFHTAQYNGKWWLVAPNGHLFFSSALDSVTPSAETFVDKRSSMFQWLPATSDPLAAFYGTATAYKGPEASGVTYDFYQANLERKYGTGWLTAWQSQTRKRLASWGFNTIGNWSDPTFCKQDKTPYVFNAAITGTFNTVPSGQDWWGAMPDPFDARFASVASTKLHDAAYVVAGDPWCIGYFVDNELSWGDNAKNHYGLAYGALSQSNTTSPAKAAFLAQLVAKYSVITKLNTAWGTNFTAWSSMNAGFAAPTTISSGMASDMSAFLLSYARKYFTTIYTTLHKYDTHHLYLGCRFANWTPEAIQAAQETCDVTSVNCYASVVDPTVCAQLARWNKPAIVGEYGFGATDHGLPWAGCASSGGTQTSRGTSMQQYFNSVLTNHQFVGLHWYQYIDQPLTGRTWDGENGNLGFVDITDSPYSALTTAATTVQHSIYATRSAAI